MNYLFCTNGISIGRDASDKKVYRESAVIGKALKDLNAGDFRSPWKRFRPDLVGLTASRIGIRNTHTGDLYWHERYQIETASEAWNAGSLFLLKA